MIRKGRLGSVPDLDNTRIFKNRANKRDIESKGGWGRMKRKLAT